MEKQRVGLSDCELTNGINIEMSTAQVGLFCFSVCLFVLKKSITGSSYIIFSITGKTKRSSPWILRRKDDAGGEFRR